ncbi:MAG: S8 family serine peptidase, partial [Telluria sp.]
MKFSYSFVGALVAATTLSAAPAMAERPDGDFARGRVLVEVQPGVSDADLAKALRPHGAKGRKLGQSRLHVVHLPAHLSEVDMVAKLSQRAEFKFAELDRKVQSTLAINDPYAGSAWHLNKVGAPAAWDAAMGAGVTIAILDSGVDIAHADLKNNLVAGHNVVGNNADVNDVCGHGTAVAGIAAASMNNGLGVAGIAGVAKIMPLRIASVNATSGACEGYISAIASGLTYAADHGARVANVSYGSISGSASIISAANYMKSKNGLVFVSAGNSNLNMTTAPTTAMIVVAATDTADNKSSFSNYGAFVSLAAPGSGIWTTSRGGIYQAWNGTSFASPLAAGVAALMMSARPDLSGAQIEKLLFSSALDLGSAGKDPVYGNGRVNAAAAVAAARAFVASVDTTAPVAAIGSPAASSSVTGSVTVSVGASDNVGVTRVDLKVNGTVVASDTSAPYSFVWNTAGVANGMNSLVAVAYDGAGNAGASPALAVNVANGSTTSVTADTLAPTLSIDNPVAGAVSGTVSVAVSATDDSAAAGMTQTLTIDATIVATGNGGALAYSWNTRKMSRG